MSRCCIIEPTCPRNPRKRTKSGSINDHPELVCALFGGGGCMAGVVLGSMSIVARKSRDRILMGTMSSQAAEKLLNSCD